MGWVYKFTDLSDEKVKYVGIVYAEGRTLYQRVYEHFRDDEWCKGDFRIEYINVNSRTDASAYESHYITLYKTYEYFNKDKSDWGLSEYLLNRDSEWEALPYTNFNHMKKYTTTHSRRKRRIFQYSLDGVFIREWESAREVIRGLNLPYSAISNLSCTIKGEKYSYKGFIWRYADEYDGILQLNKEECVPKTNAIRVAMYSLNMEFIRVFDSISEAARFVGLSVYPIYKCLTGKQKTSAGYIWKYADDMQINTIYCM